MEGNKMHRNRTVFTVYDILTDTQTHRENQKIERLSDWEMKLSQTSCDADTRRILIISWTYKML